LLSGEGHHLAKIPAGTEARVSIASLHIAVFRVDGYELVAGILYCLSFVWKVYKVGKYQVMRVGEGKSGAQRLVVSRWRKGAVCAPSVECLVNFHESFLTLVQNGLFLEQATKAQRGRRGITLLFP
jgi:hypothetical protein